jgi:hypothetical protein
MYADEFTVRPAHNVVALRLLVLVGVAFAVLVGLVQPASASVSPTALTSAKVTGVVYAVAQVGDRTIIGGSFTAVGGLPRSNVAAILSNGTVDPTFAPATNGVVYGVSGSEDGTRVFIGGDFTSVSGVGRADLAAVDARSGSIIGDWQADTDGIVHTVAVRGTRLYAGGSFATIKGVSRKRLAAVDVATSVVNTGFNPWPSWTVKQIAVSPEGTKVYATGGFTSIGGAPRRGAAEVLASTGKATAFNPSQGGVGIAAALSPDGTRFFFSTTDNRMYAYDPARANTPIYTIQTGGDTQAIAVSTTEVYFGGHFTNITTFKTKRSLLASVRLTDGALTTWNPNLSGYMGPWAIATSPTKLIVGGDITKVGTKATGPLAFFTGTP